MKVVPTELEGVFVLKPNVFEDARGTFVKTYHEESFTQCGLRFAPKEEFFSVSRKNVLRGMHFHRPPAAHDKLVYCPAGRFLDVVLDLRSKAKGVRYISRELSAQNREMLFIPAGCAHGFLALDDDSMMIYQLSALYSPKHDEGVLWNSFGFDWPVKNPILSERDQKFSALGEFQSPF
jgi:dTDP-4-dehydrorhamnose 3,5-epimerase